eukprot:gnl/Chilomastix_cuspidata/2342.p1 GENE.gnl/Chilomastix_cuspidata/2342~~gnl/Chilomastix_cuspidata/2342.p1  ORF type:complete len:208 (-),score=47.14 gnl/Chilomastix_cuspidata/2342:297-920(-)
MSLRFQTFPLGRAQANCYVLFDIISKESYLVDPGDMCKEVVDFVRENALEVKGILLTHGHFDHVFGVPFAQEQLGTPTFLHPDDVEAMRMNPQFATLFRMPVPPGYRAEPDEFLHDAMELPLGAYRLKVLHTPGHTPGSCCFLTDGILLSGDTLFRGGVGRYDLPGSSLDALKESLAELQGKVPGDTIVLPGHGPTTFIRDESFKIP